MNDKARKQYSFITYAGKHAQLATSLLTSRNGHVINKSISRCVRMHGLRQLVDDKSVASYLRTCFKLIFKACDPQTCWKFFQQVVTNLQMTSCNKSDFDRVVKLSVATSPYLWRF